LAIAPISFGVTILEPKKQQYIGWWLKLYGFSNVLLGKGDLGERPEED